MHVISQVDFTEIINSLAVVIVPMNKNQRWSLKITDKNKSVI